MSEVAWLGVGRMGEPMVERLLAGGIGVHVWNRSPGKLAGVLGRGARPLRSPAEAGRAAVAFSMVLDDEALRWLAEADDGLLSGRQLPRVWVDCSTVSPQASERAASAAAARGVRFVSAPVSGNPTAVRSGNLTFAVSGPPPAVALVRPLLGLIGREVTVFGDGHEARVVKVGVNAVLAVVAEALAESLVLTERYGVRRRDFMAFLNDSAVGSRFTRSKTQAFVALDMTPMFTPEGQRKDLRLALALGAEGDVPLPVVAATEHEFSRLIDSGLGEGRDFAALLLRAAQDAGMSIEPEEP